MTVVSMMTRGILFLGNQFLTILTMREEVSGI
jgi:hypothetical protein